MGWFSILVAVDSEAWIWWFWEVRGRRLKKTGLLMHALVWLGDIGIHWLASVERSPGEFVAYLWNIHTMV